MNTKTYIDEYPVEVPQPDHTMTTQTENYGTYEKIYEDSKIIILKKYQEGTWS